MSGQHRGAAGDDLASCQVRCHVAHRNRDRAGVVGEPIWPPGPLAPLEVTGGPVRVARGAEDSETSRACGSSPYQSGTGVFEEEGMTVKERWFPSHLREMDREECLELLASVPVGRVAYCVLSGPVVLPVNYVLDGEDIIFRTSPHKELGRQMLRGSVAFQIDDYDEFNQSGWSVLVRGSAEYDDPDEVRPEDQPGPWAEGNRILIVRIRPRLITGRRLFPA